MHSERRNHSMIYLEDMNSVLVCGGEKYINATNDATNDAEITNITLGTWKQIIPLIEARISPMLLYFNQRTVFCFGGSDGNYLINSCESIDIKSQKSSWKIIPVEKKT